MPEEKTHRTSKNTDARKPVLTDAERHRRFLDLAKESGAEDNAAAFDAAFQKVTEKKPEKKEK